MNKINYLQILLNTQLKKLLQSIKILKYSLQKIAPFDDNIDYTYEELEPYDALSDRFIRAVEVALKFFRTYHLYNEGLSPDTLRDLLSYCEKQELISSTDIWIEMREVRNRIVHDYIPEQQKLLYDDITGPFAVEIKLLEKKIETITIR